MMGLCASTETLRGADVEKIQHIEMNGFHFLSRRGSMEHMDTEFGFLSIVRNPKASCDLNEEL